MRYYVLYNDDGTARYIARAPGDGTADLWNRTQKRWVKSSDPAKGVYLLQSNEWTPVDSATADKFTS